MESCCSKDAVFYQAPNADGHGYSRSVLVDGIIYTHGQLGVDGMDSGENFMEQGDKAMARLLAELKAYGASLKDVFKVNIFLTPAVDMANEYKPWHKKAFAENPNPIRTTVVVSALGPYPHASIKIELFARKPK